ncbi:MAG TPA: DegV family protein [Clostridia bacterium]|nr:DegV family protein [Clostridia bacterium]
MIKIIIDSTAYITKEELEQHDITVVPLNIDFLGSQFPDIIPGSFDDFYKKLRESKEFPKTSQPSVGAFAEIFEQELAKGNEILVLTISTGLSGTYNSAIAAKNTFNTDKIAVVDTLSSVACMKFLVDIAVKMRDEGVGLHQIAQAVTEKRPDACALLTVGDLEYLRRGGRLTNAQAVIGTLLDIKPIILFKGGILKAIEKVRGRKKTLNRIIEMIPQNASRLQALHIDSAEEAGKINEKLKELFPDADILPPAVIGPVIGSHLGPGTIGITYIL